MSLATATVYADQCILSVRAEHRKLRLPKGTERPDRDQRAPVPINRMRARVSVNPRSSAVSNRAIIG